MDELLSLEDTEHTVNFKSGSKDIAVTQRSANRADKVFTVNVIREGEPSCIWVGGELSAEGNGCGWHEENGDNRYYTEKITFFSIM